MPITFKSRHAPDILMLEAVALELIQMMGHSGTLPGALAPQDLPAALARLRAAIGGLTDASLEAERKGAADDDETSRETAVSAAHRALPLIAMLETAIANGDHVMWAR